MTDDDTFDGEYEYDYSDQDDYIGPAKDEDAVYGRNEDSDVHKTTELSSFPVPVDSGALLQVVKPISPT